MPITYYDRTTQVQLGDKVETKVWFRRRSGRIAYVPGISLINVEFEHDGLRWVGIRLENGSIVATVVDPKGDYILKKSLKFVERDPTSVEEIALGPEGFDGFSP